ncbi:MAG: hypothetical protein KKH01_06490 [Firmicutes bacterium]|nr:hypothetical protein [Bacillota bacterium]
MNKFKLIILIILAAFFIYSCTPEETITILCEDNETLIDGNCEITPVVCDIDQTLENGICVTLPPECS